MTEPAPVTWTVTARKDLAHVRAALDHALTDVPAEERLRLLSDLTAHVGARLDDSTGPVLVQATADDTSLTLHVHDTSTPADRPHCAHQPHCAHRPHWEQSLACAQPHAVLRRAATNGADPGTALLSTDRDIADLLARLSQQAGLLDSHREELHHTNQGVLALHAELDTAAKEQRRLLAAERAARAQAEDARRRLLFLTEASAALAASLSHDAIIATLRKLLVPAYARAANVRLQDDRQERGTPPPATPDALTSSPHPAPLQLPLTVGRTTLGVLSLTPLGDTFTDDDVTLLRELAHRTAVALDNALRYERQRDTAEALQQALLSDLPTAGHVHLAARYLPATRGLNVGGDWYDAFTQPDGSTTIVIGDVTGHGLRAAVMMGQLRTALRAYAVAGDSPGALLARLHTFIPHVEQELYATAVVARLQPGEPTVTWAAAGHLPPLLRTPDGRVRVLAERSGVMLGLPVQRPFPDHTAPFLPGSTLLLYTDGLVERRDSGIDPGIDRLSRGLAALHPSTLSDDLDHAADTLLAPMLADSDGDDDVCFVLCHAPLVPAPVRRPVLHRRIGGAIQPAGT
ncbi:PP2C family protein-serine/threonine phosphatase [Kitasatospora sp. NPDC048194]|uniref:PP2C family protein-serine/threonine phosphatase n=1 Tax=Kitasatospora sp. NPDC048194 TaxID=3364045 RepID=UPI003712EBC8